MKRQIAFLVCIIMCICTALTPLCAEAAPEAEAAETRDYTEAEKAAQDLKSLGLFKGVSDTDFDLDRAPTRTEALVMLIRLLGEEAQALEGEYTHPFTDVAEWADGYVGYAYECGLTNGISATEFGTSDASAAMYLTFVLRALGYSDAEGGDFTWDAPFDLASEIGILPETVNTEEFFRADVAIVSYHALEAYIKDSELTLANVLVLSGVFTAEQYAAICPPPAAPELKYNYISDFTDYDINDGLDENGFFEGIRALDYVTLPDYRNIPDAKEYLTVTEDEIAEEIALVLEEYGSQYEQITDRAVAEGDNVNMDMVMIVNGERLELDEFKGLEGEIRIDPTEEEVAALAELFALLYGGSTDEVVDAVVVFGKDLMAKVVGSFPGESVKATFVYPESELYPQLNDVVLEMEVTVNYILGEELPSELTDEVAKEYGFENVEALIEDLTNWIYTEKYTEFAEYVLEEAVVNEIPSAVVEYIINSSLYTIDAVISEYGMTLEEYVMDYYGYESLDEYVAFDTALYEEYAADALVIQALAEAEGITVTDEIIAENGYTEYVELFGRPYVCNALLSDAVARFIGTIYN